VTTLFEINMPDMIVAQPKKTQKPAANPSFFTDIIIQKEKIAITITARCLINALSITYAEYAVREITSSSSRFVLILCPF
jgi:hypothetical protein